MTINHSSQPWGGSHSRAIRELWRTHLPQPCGLCGQPVDGTTPWVVGHIESRGARPDRTYDVTNTGVEHRHCSNSTAQQGVIDKAKAEARRELGADSAGQPPKPVRPPWRPHGPAFLGATPQAGIAAQSRARAQDDRSGRVSWDQLMSRPWLADLAVIPPDAAAPRAMSPPHPTATGSHGVDAERWIEVELSVRLRWWQRLALRRALEHGDDGELLWRTVLASTPRRAGKSVLMMALAAWRLTHGRELGERRQTIVHTGQDLAVVSEVMRLAFSWATRNKFLIRRKNGQEAVEAGESRWLMRSQSATYGYEVSLGLVDECWAVPSAVLDDALEPALIGRRSPQLLLTSTAHRRATSLMRRRLAAAMDGMNEDFSTLLLWWGAPDGEPGDPETWRQASPYFTEQTRQLISDRWERVLRGEGDPQADDPDAVEGFKCQYLNAWPPPHAPLPAREVPAVPRELWDRTLVELPDGRPAGAGIESTFAGGLAVALAYRDDRGHIVTAQQVASMVDAVDVVLASGALTLIVGKSLAGDASLIDLDPVQVIAKGGTSRAAVTELRRLVDEGQLRHADSPVLDQQVCDLMVSEGTDGPRMKAGSRTDMFKAVTWAVEAATEVLEPPQIF